MATITALSEGRVKFTILTTKPANPAAPTVTELNAGIDASCRILASDFTWTTTDSDKTQEKVLCAEGNANSLGASNYSAGVTALRYWDSTTKAADLTGDAVFAALKVKGTTVWAYARETAKKSTEAWAAGDEIYLGGEVVTDEPQKPSEAGGAIKRRIPMEMQLGYTNIEVAATGGP